MGGHGRGNAAIAHHTKEGLTVIGRGLALGLVSALGWKFLVADPNSRYIAKLNKTYEVKRAKERKAFDAWLAAQPFDDETPATA